MGWRKLESSMPPFEPQPARYGREGQPRPASVEVGQHAPGVAFVNVLGEHDLSTRGMLRSALDEGTVHSSLLVDLSGCSFIDAGVIELLTHAARQLQARDQQFVLVIPPEQQLVARVAALTGLTNVFPIYPSRELALAHFQTLHG
jgi:anti-anti-sigma factor